MSLDEQISICAGLLKDGQRVLEQPGPDISMEYMEGIANVRYALMVVAELLHRQPNTPIMIQTEIKQATQASKDVTEQEDSEEETQLSESAAVDEEEKGTMSNELESALQPLVPTKALEENECIEVEIVETQPFSVTADKEQEQTTQPQDIGGSVEEFEENIPKLKVNISEGRITEVQEVEQHSVSVDSDAGSEADPATQLLLAAQSTCRAPPTAGPSHYLLKLIVRQFGFSFLRKLVKVHPWVIPQDLMWTGEVHTHSCKGNVLIIVPLLKEEKTFDPFVIYGDLYINLREAIGSATHSKQFTDLTEETEVYKMYGSASPTLYAHFLIGHYFRRDSTFDAGHLSKDNSEQGQQRVN